MRRAQPSRAAAVGGVAAAAGRGAARQRGQPPRRSLAAGAGEEPAAGGAAAAPGGGSSPRGPGPAEVSGTGEVGGAARPAFRGRGGGGGGRAVRPLPPWGGCRCAPSPSSPGCPVLRGRRAPGSRACGVGVSAFEMKNPGVRLGGFKSQPRLGPCQTQQCLGARL